MPKRKKDLDKIPKQDKKKKWERKDLPKIPKELHSSFATTFPTQDKTTGAWTHATIKLKEEDKVYIDNLCLKKVLHPRVLDLDKKPLEGESYGYKMMTLAESIEYIGNSYRNSLSQTKYFPTKEQNDAFLKELRDVSNRLKELLEETIRDVSNRLKELLEETIYEDKSVRLILKNNKPIVFGGRARDFGISVDTIATLKKAIKKLQPDIDRVDTISTLKKAIKKLQPDIDLAKKRNRPRLLQKIGTDYRCLVYDAVKDAFKRYGLTPTYWERLDPALSEVTGTSTKNWTKRSPFFQCLYIALQHAGETTIENMDKVHQHSKEQNDAFLKELRDVSNRLKAKNPPSNKTT